MKKLVRKGRRLVGVFFALGFLLLSFYGVNLKHLWLTIVGINYYLLIPIFILQFIIVLSRTQRWRIILDPVKKVGFLKVLSAYSLGWLANFTLPALTGQVARTYLLSKKHNLPKTLSFTTITLEIIFDGLTLVLLVGLVSLVFAFPAWILRGEYTVAIIVFSLLVLFYIIVNNKKAIAKWGKKHENKVSRKIAEKVANFYNSFTLGLDMLKSSRHVVAASFFSFLAWFSQIMMVLLLIRSFSFELPFWAALVVIVVNTFLLIFPITPGNLGTFQVASISGLALFGVAKTEALGFSVLLHLIDILPWFLLSTLFILKEPKKLQEVTHPHM